MRISINREQDLKEVNSCTVIINKSANETLQYKITVNQFNELVINKSYYGDGESAITIKPSVSNEIRII